MLGHLTHPVVMFSIRVLTANHSGSQDIAEKLLKVMTKHQYPFNIQNQIYF